MMNKIATHDYQQTVNKSDLSNEFNLMAGNGAWTSSM